MYWNPDRSWWHHHTSLKLFWPHPMDSRTQRKYQIENDLFWINHTHLIQRSHMKNHLPIEVSFYLKHHQEGWPVLKTFPPQLMIDFNTARKNLRSDLYC